MPAEPARRFAVELTRDAEKDLKRRRPWTAQAKRALLRLEEDPYRGHPLTGSLRGVRSLEFSPKGSGLDRAAYVVLDGGLVFLVGPHENVYEKAERRLAALRRAGRV